MKIKIMGELKEYDPNVLNEFACLCKKNDIDRLWSIEFRLIRDGLLKFGIDIKELTSYDILEYSLKKKERKLKLIKNGKNPSIIDLSYWEIFAPNKMAAIKKFDEINKSKSKITSRWNNANSDKLKGSSLEYQIKKYGEEEGTKRFSESNKKRREKNPIFLEYWINNGYSYEDAVIKRKERQTTFSKEKLISKYGKSEGTLIWKRRQEKWQETMSSKTNEELIEINLKKNAYCVRGYLLRGYTEKEAKSLIDERIKNSKKNFTSLESIQFFENNFEVDGWVYGAGNEWFLWDNDSRKHYFYDFVNLKNKVIIEYNGEAFHPNKKVLNENEWQKWSHPFTNETADERLSFDNYKNMVAANAGFKLYQIYSNDKPDVISDTIKKIKDEIKNNP